MKGEREREGGGEREKEGGREREREPGESPIAISNQSSRRVLAISRVMPRALVIRLDASSTSSLRSLRVCGL